MAGKKTHAAKRPSRRDRTVIAPETSQRLEQLATSLATLTSEAAAISDRVREGLEGEETKRQIVRSGSAAKPK